MKKTTEKMIQRLKPPRGIQQCVCLCACAEAGMRERVRVCIGMMEKCACLHAGVCVFKCARCVHALWQE